MKFLQKISSILSQLLEVEEPCKHEWKCIHQVEHRIYDEPWDKYPAEKYLKKTWECQKCGEVKYTKIDLL